MRVVRCLLLGLLLMSLGEAFAAPLSRLSVAGDRIVDAAGRTVVLRGVNLGRKNAPFLPDRAEADYAALGRWGFNCVRFYLNWAAIEPEPGVYDAAFMEGVAQQVAWANVHGVYVLLDIHQDLYSEKIPGGNGAPAWATLDDGQPHVMPGGPWGAAYFTSPQVHQAFDSFWANREGPGGVGLQDRFAAAAQALARRFADNPGVMGIDLYNEPGLGSDVTQVLPALMQAVPALMALPDPPQGLLASLASGDALGQFEAISRRRDVYLWGVDAITPVLQEFERAKLQPFYDRVGQAIRAVSPDLILVFEPPVLANSGARSALRPLHAATGAPLPNQVYGAHAYDLVTDSDAVAEPSATRLSIMFERLAEHAAQMQLPAVVGEWGAYYGNKQARAAAQLVVAEFERYRLGDLYWDYESGLRQKAYFDQLCRPYPQAVAGPLETWHFDQEARALHLVWQEAEAATGATRVYLPRVWFAARPEVQVTPASALTWHVIEGEDGGWLVDIAPGGSAGKRTLRTQPALQSAAVESR
jgi:endoglycosylceramidase